MINKVMASEHQSVCLEVTSMYQYDLTDDDLTHPSRSGSGAHLHVDGMTLVSQQRGSAAQLDVEVGGVWSEAEVPTETRRKHTKKEKLVGVIRVT